MSPQTRLSQERRTVLSMKMETESMTAPPAFIVLGGEEVCEAFGPS